ncbi:hypothetical protein [Natronorubrum texcoconense]|uniref:Uncharacterized protein n=1 Tax=Natronorubrum texcoconense TaxID=1095776 RepID=A0A1G8YRP7_9EURY|nr:hypothetical protein [Natronorubrum texcoconense]SDK04700.1 hypothetical protein SAMN04515672_2252 [Natronorubrum texcoconense]
MGDSRVIAEITLVHPELVFTPPIEVPDIAEVFCQGVGDYPIDIKEEKWTITRPEDCWLTSARAIFLFPNLRDPPIKRRH